MARSGNRVPHNDAAVNRDRWTHPEGHLGPSWTPAIRGGRGGPSCNATILLSVPVPPVPWAPGAEAARQWRASATGGAQGGATPQSSRIFQYSKRMGRLIAKKGQPLFQAG